MERVKWAVGPVCRRIHQRRQELLNLRATVGEQRELLASLREDLELLPALQQDAAELIVCRSRVAELEYLMTPPPPPAAVAEVSRLTLDAMVRDAVGYYVLIYLAHLGYHFPRLSALMAFIEWAGVWKMLWTLERPTCSDFTRKLKGLFVCPGWWYIAPMEIRFDRLPGPEEDWHSELLTGVIDDSEEPWVNRLYLIDGQSFEVFRPAKDYFQVLGRRALTVFD